MIKIKYVYDTKEPEDGKWILIDRDLPEDISKNKIDEWYPELAHFIKLKDELKMKKIDGKEYLVKYLKELVKNNDLIDLFTKKAREENITFVSSREDGYYYHEHLLWELVNRGISLKELDDFFFFKIPVFVLQKLKKYRESIELLDKSIKLRPEDHNIWFLKGVYCVKTRNYEEAKTSFNKAIEIGLNDVNIWFAKGYASFRLGKHKESVEFLDKAIKLDPYISPTWYFRGANYFFLSNYKSAKDDFKKAREIARKQKMEKLEVKCGMLFHLTLVKDEIPESEKECENAIKEYEECSILAPLDPLIYFRIGYIHLILRRHEKASENFRKVIEIYNAFKDKKLKITDKITALAFRDKKWLKRTCSISELYGNHARGFSNLANGYFLEAERDFIKANKIIRYNKFENMYHALSLYEIAKVDRKISELCKCSDFQEIEEHILEICKKLDSIDKKRIIGNKLIDDLILCKKNYIVFIWDLLNPQFRQGCRDILSEEKRSPEEIKELEKKVFILEYVEKPVVLMKQIRFQQLINCLKNFALEIKRFQSLKDIPLDRQRQLIISLAPVFDNIDGHLTVESISKDMKNLLLGQDRIKKILESLQKIEKEIKTEEKEEKEYRTWYKDSEPKGEPINAEDKEDKIKNAKDWELLIVREETGTQVFINGQKSKSPPSKLAYRILRYVLQHKGRGGSAWNIAQHVWSKDFPGLIDEPRELVKAVIKESDLKKAQELKKKIDYWSSRTRRKIIDLNKYLMKTLKIKLEAKELDEYELSPKAPNYCLIEKV